MKQYLSDIISQEQIQQWTQGDKILINAPTGSGKTHFITNSLYSIALEQNKLILLLVNRTILLKQQNEYNKYKDNLHILSYQDIEQDIINEKCDYLQQYDYIICDECHYFFTDSMFNDSTDVSLCELTKNCNNSISLYMSATIHQFRNYLKKEFGENSYIELGFPTKLYYTNLLYWTNYNQIDKILYNLPKDDKAIVFFSNAELAYEYHIDKFPNNSSFICSPYNKGFADFSDDIEKENIINNNKFNKQILFTTSVLDNGINILDPQVKHIIIDIFDLDTVQQCIGRKRIENENEQLNIYIKKFNNSTIITSLKQKERVLQCGKEFKYNLISRKDFVNKYNGKFPKYIVYPTLSHKNKKQLDLDKIINNLEDTNENVDLTLNLPYYYKLYSDCMIMRVIETLPNVSNLEFIKTRYNLPNIDCFKNINEIINNNGINGIEQFVDMELYGESKDKFIKWFMNNSNNRYQGNSIRLNTLNDWFIDNELNYKCESVKKMINKQTYMVWIIKETKK